MKISFLIPSYNHEKYIQHTLDSIKLDAEDFDFEVVLIDDGSSDKTLEVVKGWQQANPNINMNVSHRENRGVSVTLNELIGKASGDIFRLCASDDAIFPGSSEKILKMFKNTEYDVLVGDAIVIDCHGNTLVDSAITKHGGNIYKMQTEYGLKKEILSNWSIPGPCFAIKKATYKLTGGYSEDLLIEDWDFFLRVISKASIGYSNQIFAYYRIHTQATTQSRNWSRRFALNNAQVLAAVRNLDFFSGFFKFILIGKAMKLSLISIYLLIRKLFAS